MMRKAKDDHGGRVEELLQDLLITSLGIAGVKQSEIRKIVGCSMDRVSRIAKHIERSRKNVKERE
jgi:predicted transcriptional regulator